jgi:hypothetical protein
LPHSSELTGSCSQKVVCKMFTRQKAFNDERETWQLLRAREALLINSAAAAAAADPRLDQLLAHPHLTPEGEYCHRNYASIHGGGHKVMTSMSCGDRGCCGAGEVEWTIDLSHFP